MCAASCGPGNLHLINGLFDAQRSRVPVLAIAAHIPRTEIGTGYFQETHPQELFRECSVYTELVSIPEQLPRILLRRLDTSDAQLTCRLDQQGPDRPGHGVEPANWDSRNCVSASCSALTTASRSPFRT